MSPARQRGTSQANLQEPRCLKTDAVATWRRETLYLPLVRPVVCVKSRISFVRSGESGPTLLVGAKIQHLQCNRGHNNPALKLYRAGNGLDMGHSAYNTVYQMQSLCVNGVQCVSAMCQWIDYLTVTRACK